MIRQIITILLVGVVLVWGGSAAVADSDVTVKQLRCEYRANPLGIDVVKPRLNWIIESAQRGQRQSAYQILVAGSEESLKQNKAELWDSGKVESDQSVHVVYEGKPLKSRIRCYWKVRIWDKDGKVSAWSGPAMWTMGLLKRADWKAKWIGFDTTALNEDPELHLPPSPYLRKEFKLSQKVRRATVYVSALGLFELSINGQRVGRDYFTPGWTNYSKRVYYLTYDVTKLLRDGDNAVGAILSNGWYAGYVGFALLIDNLNPYGVYGQKPALLAQLEIEYEDGEREIFATDKSWKASTGPIRGTDIQMGETYDATKEKPGWDRTGFDDHDWKTVSRMRADKGKLGAYPGVTVQKTQQIRPIEITEPNKGVYVFNMGQNFAGMVRLKVKGKAGTKVVLRFAEMLHQDGTIMTENLRKARATDTYILRGDGKDEIWEPSFTYHGFQYVEVTGYPGRPNLDAITGIVLHSVAPVTGSFECSNAMVNKLYSNITWTQRANFFEVPTDCPQRDERLGWTGDAQIYIRSATYNMDVAAFFTKWLVDLEDDQLPTGAFPNFAPSPYIRGEGYSPAWMDAGVICPYTIYKVYGDTRVIERHYDAMKRFMDFLLRTSKGYLRPADGSSYGDWLSVNADTPKDLIATAYFAYDAKLMAEMAAVIGRTEDAENYARLFDNIRAAFKKAYVSSDGRIKGNTQTCYALALYMDLLPQELRKKAGQYLVELIRERDWQLSTGFLGVKHILPALTEQGYAGVAFRLLTNKTYPSWGYSIENGATTIWERWNSYTKEKGFAKPGMNSFSHYAFGSVCEWMFASMAGIDTDGPGFKRIIIRPRLGGGMTYTKAGYKSIRGKIATHWRLEGDVLKLDVTIPANTTATVYVPTKDVSSVTESGRPAAKAEGVRFLRTEDGAAVYQVGSGSYSFASRGAENVSVVR